MNFPILISYVAGGLALALAVAAAISRPRNPAQWTFLIGMIALGIEALCQAASLGALSLPEMLALQKMSAWPLAIVPGSWLVFSLSFARGNQYQFLLRWRPAIVASVLIPLGIVALQPGSWVTDATWTSQAGHWAFPVNWAGKALHAIVVVSAVLIITNLEWTYRASVGTSRWKIKYAVMGLALLFGVRIYSSSQVILYSANHAQLIVFNTLALVFACVLLGVWAQRSRLHHVDLYPSTAVLHKSLTVLLTGAYLIVVGLLARLITAWGGADTFSLQALVILAALVGLTMLSMSDRVRQATRQFISRHFQRPVHDYRAVWSTFTRRTATVLEKQLYARAAAKVISETFELLSVTVWLTDPVHRRLSLAASTTSEATAVDATSLPEEIVSRFVGANPDASRPVDLEYAPSEWSQPLKDAHPALFAKGGHRYCVPLVFGDEPVGLLIVGDRVNGQPFSGEDLELLKCLGDQIAAGARNLTLSERLVAAKELEAFQAMSAFLVHDLKNTASALGLTLRNLPAHFANPAFREDALRTLGKSVGRVNELIERLTALRQKMEISPAPTDLNQVITSALASTTDLAGVAVVRNLQPLPLVPLDARQFESVITNLVLNARDAVAAANHHPATAGPVVNGATAAIRIATARDNQWATLAISDNGCGMSPEFIAQSLFRPFKTTKKAGLGIGMFHVKTIIEAHRGRIAVESEPGRGTTFRIWLPLAAT